MWIGGRLAKNRHFGAALEQSGSPVISFVGSKGGPLNYQAYLAIAAGQQGWLVRQSMAASTVFKHHRQVVAVQARLEEAELSG